MDRDHSVSEDADATAKSFEFTPTKRKRRRRTTSAASASPVSRSPSSNYYVPGFNHFSDRSPIRMQQMSLSQALDAANGLTNMFLAHEVAVDKDFKLQDLVKEPTDPSAEVTGPQDLEEQVRLVVQNAFWDKLAEELDSEPPVLDQTIELMTEVKTSLISLLNPSYQRRVIDQIDEKLDLELIKQQASAGALDFRAYGSYIVELLSRLCAPVRDAEVAKLQIMVSEVSDQDNHEPVIKGRYVASLFKAILTSLEHMRIDLANFHLQQARPLITSQSVVYEKAKFGQVVEKQREAGIDGLERTKLWLAKAKPCPKADGEASGQATLQADSVASIRASRALKLAILRQAYMSLLAWDDDENLPETWFLDARRVADLQNMAEKMALSTAVILITFSYISKKYVKPIEATSLKTTIKGHVDDIIVDFVCDDDLEDILPNVSLAVIKDVNEHLSSSDDSQLLVMSDDDAKTITEAILALDDPIHRIRSLVHERICEFCITALTTELAKTDRWPRQTDASQRLQVPPGLTLCQKDLFQLAAAYVRLVAYNDAVFHDFYMDAINSHVLA